MQVNLTGTFYCCRAVVPVMLRAALRPDRDDRVGRGKRRQPERVGLQRVEGRRHRADEIARKELATENIAVNCITPAAAQTRILEQITQQHIDFMLSKIPRGRFLKVDELASLATWLASEENSFSTGAVWDLSGGRSTY